MDNNKCPKNKNLAVRLKVEESKRIGKKQATTGIDVPIWHV